MTWAQKLYTGPLDPERSRTKKLANFCCSLSKKQWHTTLSNHILCSFLLSRTCLFVKPQNIQPRRVDRQTVLRVPCVCLLFLLFRWIYTSLKELQCKRRFSLPSEFVSELSELLRDNVDNINRRATITNSIRKIHIRRSSTETQSERKRNYILTARGMCTLPSPRPR